MSQQLPDTARRTTSFQGMSLPFYTLMGKTVDLARLQPDDISISDIAVALSHICRFTGHVHYFYSVAQHSTLVADLTARLGGEGLQLVALLHDASEAYTGDLHTYVKRDNENFQILESSIQYVVAEALGLPRTLDTEAREVIHLADQLALMIEFRDVKYIPEGDILRLMEERELLKYRRHFDELRIFPQSAVTAYQDFLTRYGRLQREVHI